MSAYKTPDVTIEDDILTARWSPFHSEIISLRNYPWYVDAVPQQREKYCVLPFCVYFPDIIYRCGPYALPMNNRIRYTISKSHLYLMRLYFYGGKTGLKIGMSYDPYVRAKAVGTDWNRNHAFHDELVIHQIEVLGMWRAKSDDAVALYERHCKSIIKEHDKPVSGTLESILLPSPAVSEWVGYLKGLVKSGDLF